MSNYNALQIQVTKRTTHGYELHAAYTWSHALDDSNDSILPGANGVNRGLPRDSYHLIDEYGNATDDQRQNFTAYGTWQLPIGSGRSYLNHGFVGRLFEGIQLSGITKAGTGLPNSVLICRQRSGDPEVDASRRFPDACAFSVTDPIEGSQAETR